MSELPTLADSRHFTHLDKNCLVPAPTQLDVGRIGPGKRNRAINARQQIIIPALSSGGWSDMALGGGTTSTLTFKAKPTVNMRPDHQITLETHADRWKYVQDKRVDVAGGKRQKHQASHETSCYYSNCKRQPKTNRCLIPFRNNRSSRLDKPVLDRNHLFHQ